MKKSFILLITMLAITGLSFNSFAQVKTYPYPVEEFGPEWKAEAIEYTEPEEVLAAEEAEITKEGMRSKNWDDSVRNIKKRRGFKKVKDHLEKVGEKGAEGLDKLFTKLEQISIDFSLKQSIDIVDGLQIKGRYEYETEPAFYGNFFSRLDGYSVHFPIKALELFGLDSVFGLNATPGVRVQFYQFFDKLSDARKPKNGYLPTRVPLTAQAALENLKPGDLVMIDGDLNYAYGVGKLWDKIKDWLKFSISGYRHVNGRFRAFVFRADNKLVRVRVSALRDTPKVINAKLSIFDLFDLGWGKLTELVEKALGLNKLIEAQLQWVDRDLWLADYTLDLNDPRVRSAYDAVFKRQGRYRGVFGITNPFAGSAKLSDKLFDLVGPLTEIAVNEQNKANPAARINFMGSNFSNGELVEIEAGVRGALRGQVLRSKKNNFLKQTLYTADGDPYDKYYFYPSWVRRKEHSGGATLFKERKHQAANIIYSTDENFNIVEFENIGFYREETDKAYTYSEHIKILESFQKILPPSVFENFVNYLASKDWGKFKRDRQNVRISARYFISKEGLKRVEHVRAIDIQRVVLASLHELDRETKRFAFAGEYTPTGTKIPKEICPLDELRAAGAKTWKQVGRNTWRTDAEGEDLGEYTFKYCKKIKKLSIKLEKALRPGLEARKRHELFSSFTKSRLFLEVGPGVLFDLLGAGSQKIDDLTFFEIILNASGQAEPVRFTHGKIDNRPLYEIILQMERILNEDQPDMRLPGKEESIVRKIYDNI